MQNEQKQKTFSKTHEQINIFPVGIPSSDDPNGLMTAFSTYMNRVIFVKGYHQLIINPTVCQQNKNCIGDWNPVNVTGACSSWKKKDGLGWTGAAVLLEARWEEHITHPSGCHVKHTGAAGSCEVSERWIPAAGCAVAVLRGADHRLNLCFPFQSKNRHYWVQPEDTSRCVAVQEHLNSSVCGSRVTLQLRFSTPCPCKMCTELDFVALWFSLWCFSVLLIRDRRELQT